MALRVLHICPGNLFGGVESLLVTLAREERSSPNLRMEFAVCFDGRLSEELTIVGKPPLFLGNVSTRFPWQIWRARRRLKAVLSCQDFNVVICHMPWTLAVFGKAAKQCGLPVTFWMHNDVRQLHWTERWARRLRPDLVICNSAFTARSVGSLYENVPPVTIFYPVSKPAVSFSTCDREHAREEFQTDINDVVIVQVSRMEAWKGHRLLFEALRALSALDGWTCWIVGGAQRPAEIRYRAEIEQLAKTYGIGGRMRFLGERRDVPRILAAADVFCQPNLTPEPFGIVFVEALWAGLPVVGTAMGGALEIINDTCGRLVPEGDVQALSDVLERLIRCPMVRTALAQNASRRAEQICAPMAALASLEAALTVILTPGNTR